MPRRQVDVALARSPRIWAQLRAAQAATGLSLPEIVRRVLERSLDSWLTEAAPRRKPPNRV